MTTARTALLSIVRGKRKIEAGYASLKQFMTIFDLSTKYFIKHFKILQKVHDMYGLFVATKCKRIKWPTL